MTGDRQRVRDRSRSTPDPLTRRALLRGSALALAGAVAGCQGAPTSDDPGSDMPPNSQTRTQTAASPNATATRVPTATPLPSPTLRTGETPTDTRTPTPEPPDELFVAPDGAPGGAGTRGEPLASLSTALDRAGPGTTVLLRDGTFRPTRTLGARGLAGTPAEPVAVDAVPGANPVFDFGAASVGGLRFSDCRHLVLCGFGVRDAPSRGLFVEDGSSDVLVEDVSVRGTGGDSNAGGSGVFVLASTDVTLRRVDSQNNYDPSSGGGNADGIDVERSPGTLLEGCVARGNSDDGIDLWQTTETTLRDCWAFDNGFDPNGNEAGDGDGFKLGGGTDSGDNRVERCVAFDNLARGFDDNGATRPVTLYNCTSWRNPVSFRLGCTIPDGGDNCPAHRLRNNLHADGRVVLARSVDAAFNSWDYGFGSPGFAGTDRSDPAFLHLAADSPAVDAGVDVGLPYRGMAPDLGAFEFRGR